MPDHAASPAQSATSVPENLYKRFVKLCNFISLDHVFDNEALPICHYILSNLKHSDDVDPEEILDASKCNLPPPPLILEEEAFQHSFFLLLS